MIDHRREVGRSVKLNGVQRMLISAHDAVDAGAVRVRRVEVEEELVRDAAVRRKTSAEAESWEELVRIVIGDDLAYSADSLDGGGRFS